MQLIATSDFYYGTPDAAGRYPLVMRGQPFDVLPTSAATVTEAARYLQDHGTGVTPEKWEKRKPRSDESYAWAKAEVARLNGARA